jgi:hypothetical protein
MFENIFGIAANSGIQMALRYAALAIAATLITLSIFRLAMFLASHRGAKAKRQWDVQPATSAEQSLMARLLNCDEVELIPQKLLTTDVRRLQHQRRQRARARF